MNTCLFLLLAAVAQDGGLEVLEGETLYQEGWLFTLSHSFKQKSRLFGGDDRVSDPFDRIRSDHRVSAGINYGLRPDLTVSALFPIVSRSLDSNAGDLSADGPGDVAAFLKWRLYRETGNRSSDNIAILAGLEFPTGSDGERDGGARLPMSLQPGSGSWDPFLGAALTLERDRWKFNSVALYQHNSRGGQDFKFGDDLVLDLSVGNRIWIEPFPGPAASLSMGLRWKHEWKSRRRGDSIRSTGGDEFSIRGSFVFHPRPVWDIVVTVEIPLYHDVNGAQLVGDFSVFFAVGYRI